MGTGDRQSLPRPVRALAGGPGEVVILRTEVHPSRKRSSHLCGLGLLGVTMPTN